MSSGGRWTDQEFLKHDQYRCDENLRSRQSIYAFQQPKIDLPKVVVDLAGATGWEAVLDVGCGNGRYLAEFVRRGHLGPLTGVDMSMGMLLAARSEAPGAGLACGDATALPIRTGSTNLVLAMHMLYHVPDLALAGAELRRVTAAGGRVVIGLNERDHLRELRTALAAASRDLGLQLDAPPGERFSLPDGHELMLRTFGSVVRHDFVGELVLSDLGPVESYVRSTISSRFVPDAQQCDYVASVLRNLPVAPGGELRVKTHSGCLVCS
jgi:SAM-dependent methyltransferase